jgi:hypothetical protein
VQQQQQQSFVFPPAGSSLPMRHVAIPTSFKTAADYKAAVLAAMTEEVRALPGGVAGHALDALLMSLGPHACRLLYMGLCKHPP